MQTFCVEFQCLKCNKHPFADFSCQSVEKIGHWGWEKWIDETETTFNNVSWYFSKNWSNVFVFQSLQKSQFVNTFRQSLHRFCWKFLRIWQNMCQYSRKIAYVVSEWCQKQVQQSKQQSLSAYCPNIYTVIVWHYLCLAFICKSGGHASCWNLATSVVRAY